MFVINLYLFQFIMKWTQTIWNLTFHLKYEAFFNKKITSNRVIVRTWRSGQESFLHYRDIVSSASQMSVSCHKVKECYFNIFSIKMQL